MSKKKDKLLKELNTLKEERANVPLPQGGHMSDLQGYQSCIADYDKKIEALEVKIYGAKANKNKDQRKGFKMAATKNTTVEVEATIIENVKGIFDIEAIKTRAAEIGVKANNAADKIAEGIKVQHLETEASVIAFKELMKQTQELKPGFKASVLKVVAKTPFIGGMVESAHDAIVDEFVNSDSVNTMVNTVFDGLKEKSDELKLRVIATFEMRDEVKILMSETIEFKDEVEALLATLDTSMENKTAEVFELETILASLYKKIQSYSDLLSNIENAQITIQGLSQKMDENIPATKQDLKAKFVIASSLMESNKAMEQFIEIVKIAEELNYTMKEQIIDSMTKYQELEHELINTKQREKRLVEIKKKETEFLKLREANRVMTSKQIAGSKDTVDSLVLEYKENEKEA